MAAKRKQDEKHLKTLREIVSLAHNKHCFDCHQRGPTYINMTTGSYVCTACSGILRGINPPHRVKSISMTSFTPDEMEFIKCHGNDFCRKVWLGLFDSRTNPEPDSKDEQKVRDFMTQKYEKKRWYVAPTDAMKEEARKMNEIVDKKSETRPLKTLLGSNVPKINVQTTKSNSLPHPPAGVSIAKPVADLPRATAPVITQEKKSASFDLLADFGGDPFANTAPAAAPAPQQQQYTSIAQSASTDGFANFESAFANNFVAPAQPPPAVVPAADATAFSSAMPQSSSTHSGFGAFTTPAMPQQNTVMSPSTASTPGQASMTSSTGSDKYAALAELDTVFSVVGPNVDWEGKVEAPTSTSTGGSGLNQNWTNGGGSSSWTTPSSGAFGSNWNTVSNTVSATNAFSSGPNPFGVSSSPFGQPAPVSSATAVPNPFLASSPPQPGGAFSQSGFGQFGGHSTAPPATQNTGGFGAAFANSTTSTNSQTPFAVQNGGLNSANWNGSAQQQQHPNQTQNLFAMPNSFQTSAAAQSQASGASFLGTTPANQFGGKVGQQQGFGQQPFASAAFGQQQSQGFVANWNTAPAPAAPAASSNPFMNLASQQAAPPRGSSTNPFL
ncbi:uncharacterized protein LOC141910878 [Tubulanus polymorphus]|uniref:uncharacterized protein LOC141910878 n=1 Tax=Tubulanus polymorphus TaxID=672921 RepID=UPI003DA5E4A3